jgi:(1->4)-alpha-D-glucan 1-alpha-D-glucosylmutase
LALLSEVPDRFGELCRRWSAVNGQHRLAGLPGPDAEWLLYQTLVGAWPLDADRAAAYMTKATKEAKVHTSWTEPDADYDEAVVAFTRAVCGDAVFQADLAAFVEPLVRPGWVNALAQTLLRLTVPGVADTYQGQELWDLSLVDPDNRRPVDFEHRRRLLASLDGHTAAGAWADADLAGTGLPKLAVTAAGLRLRRRHPDWFGPGGDYAGLTALGAAAGHVVGFTRTAAGSDTVPGRCAVVVPRLPLTLEEAGGWKDTVVDLPAGTWTSELDGTSRPGGEAPVDELLGAFPVALLVQE